MSNVWFAFIQFLQKLFVPPESTPFERYLVAQVSHLEGELIRQRQEYQDLLERLLPSNRANRPEPQTEGLVSVGNDTPSWNVRQKQLEDASRERWLKLIEDQERASEELRAKNASIEGPKIYTPAPEQVE